MYAEHYASVLFHFFSEVSVALFYTSILRSIHQSTLQRLKPWVLKLSSVGGVGPVLGLGPRLASLDLDGEGFVSLLV